MPIKPPGTPDLDLTEAGSFGVFGDAVFMTGQIQSAGTGQFNSFVQIQQNGTEQGYNTDASAQYDEKNSHNHNHSVLLADVPTIIGDGSNGTAEGVVYREFLLDLNEANGGAKPYISLDKLQIWQEEAGNLTNFTAGSGFAGAHTNYLAYDLDAGGNKWIALTSDMSHGSGQSDYRILIPNSFFINDAAHRYVTLFSQFGVQPGWGSDGGFEEWGLHGASGGSHSDFSVQKSASVPGGTADTAGEIISYTISVSNTGNTALTGITVSDPSVSNLAPVLSGAFNVGDTNLDGILSTGETWQYSASHTVTQADLDGHGNGNGVISNTVTADSNETAPVSATASVNLDYNPALTITKTSSVSSVDQAGDVINYTILVQNTGNITLNGAEVDDSQITIVTPLIDIDAPVLGPPLVGPILSGDYNIGDTNQNGFEDPGETFQFEIVGDTNHNGIEDPGETFVFTNAGDTNQNGFQDPGETFQYYNIGDTNQNGIEDFGETFQFAVSHAATPTDADHDGFNDGDVNHDNQINLGETWQYSVTYTVTQADIDNGGVVDPGLTHDNTATATTPQGASGQDSVSVAIDQNPHITLVKTASVLGGTADAAGEVISYTIDITNDGNMTLTGAVVSDPSVSDLAAVTSGGFNTGDADQDGKVDIGETWHYTANHTVTQAEMDAGGTIANTASVTTAQNATDTDSASITIVQNPHVVLEKTASVPGGTADTAGEVISYAITITNDGNVTLTNPVVSDPSVSDLAAVTSSGFNTGDADMDGVFDVGEMWHYTASHTVTQTEIDNNGGGDGTIDNTASVTTTQGASANDTASVTVVQPAVASLALDKSDAVGTGFTDSNENGHADVGIDLIRWTFQITNTGGVVLHDVVIDDPSLGGTIYGPEILDPGEIFTFVLNHFLTADDVAAHHVLNEATASGLDPANHLISVMASYDQLLPA